MELFLKDFLSLRRGEDDGLAVQEALRRCQDGDVLHLGGGQLHFTPTYAAQKEYYVSNNDYGNHSIAFHLTGRKNFTVDGDGAELMFHGSLTPFAVEGCDNITLKNFSVDYRYPNYFQARITQVGEGWFELEWDNREFFCFVQEEAFHFPCPETGTELVDDRVLVQEFDGAQKAPVAFGAPYFAVLGDKVDKTNFLAGMYRYLRAEQTNDHTLRLYGDLGFTHQAGNWLVFTPGGRENPGILLSHTRRTLLENINLYHTASMGVIAQLCEDVTLQNVQAKVRPGSDRMLSTQADATHFVNCTGTVTLRNCTFVSMMDDACNIHGIYTTAEQKLDAHTLLLRFGHYQQRGQQLYFPGDRIRLVQKETMQPYAELTVAQQTFLNGDYLYLTLEEPLPDLFAEGDAVENFSRMPAVHIDGCTCGNNRPRGVLLTTCKPILVENSEFFDMNSAIECSGDANTWYESGPVEDLVIRNNRFVNSAYAGGPVINLCPVIAKKPESAFHRHIRIENNLFQLHEKRFLSARYTDDILFSGNRYIRDPSLPSHPFGEDTGVTLENCSNCRILPVLETV